MLLGPNVDEFAFCVTKGVMECYIWKLICTPEVYCFFQFEKPGRREDFDYPDMAKEAGWSFSTFMRKYRYLVRAN